jgi:hypothetical protein
MNEMRRLINLVESAQHEQLDEAPIDDFSNDLLDQPITPDNDNAFRVGLTGIGMGAPWFMGLSDLVAVSSTVAGGVVGYLIGLTIDVFANSVEEPYKQYDRKLHAKKVIDNKPISSAIRSDIKLFMNNMLANIPNSISQYAMEIKNIVTTNTYYSTNEYDNDSEIQKRTRIIVDLLKDYIKKQNSKFDDIAKKHNLTPLQLGAMSYLLYGKNIEVSFIQKLQSKLSD